MTLHEALAKLTEYAEAGQVSPAVLAEVLGGEVRGAYDVGGEMAVFIRYPGWELALHHKDGDTVMMATIRGVSEAPVLPWMVPVVNVGRYPMNWIGFVRVVDAALEAMRQKEGRP
jgi:hypothetical protein